MKAIQIIRTIQVLALLGLLSGIAGTVSTAQAKGKDCCPRCTNKTCVPIPTDIETKKTCYEVECKEICIPKARWPWQKCCKPECGRVINVRVLKKVNYKCTSCGYRWEIPGKGKDCGFDTKLTGVTLPRQLSTASPTVASSKLPPPQPLTTSESAVKKASFFDIFR